MIMLEDDLREYIDVEAQTLKQAELDEYYTTIRDNIHLFFDRTMMFTYLGFCVCFFALGHIPELIYTQIMKRPFYAYATRNLIDFVIFVFFFGFIWVTYYKNLSGTWKERDYLGYDSTADIYVHNFVERDDLSILLERCLLICCSIIMWLRVVFMLHYNTYIGQLSGVLK
jgi:hypothetical protein